MPFAPPPPFLPPPCLQQPCRADSPLRRAYAAPKLVLPAAPPPPAPPPLPPLLRARPPYWMELTAMGEGPINTTEDRWTLRTEHSRPRRRQVLSMTDGQRFAAVGPPDFTHTQVVDDRSCPALAVSVAEMRALLAAPAPVEPTPTITEVTDYRLEATGRGGEQIVRKGTFGSSLEWWMVHTRERTRACPPAPP